MLNIKKIPRQKNPIAHESAKCTRKHLNGRIWVEIVNKMEYNRMNVTTTTATTPTENENYTKKKMEKKKRAKKNNKSKNMY